jgi:hypothetical protein
MNVRTLVASDGFIYPLCALKIGLSNHGRLLQAWLQRQNSGLSIGSSLAGARCLWSAFTARLQHFRRGSNAFLAYLSSLPEYVLHWQSYRFDIGESMQNSRERE